MCYLDYSCGASIGKVSYISTIHVNIAHCTVSIIMIVSGYNNIIVLPNCTMLYYVFYGLCRYVHMCLK